MKRSLRLAVVILGLLLFRGCGDDVNPTFHAVCEAICESVLKCFPNGTLSECVGVCLDEVGNPPCDTNQAALDACVAAYPRLSCTALEDGAVPTECNHVCSGEQVCEGVDCNDDNDCTDDICNLADGSCDFTAVADGTVCAAGAGACHQGICMAEFPCTEEGVLEAISLGGGPHTFDCAGPTTVTTTAEIVIDRDVILDGEGNLRLDGNDSHRVVRTAWVGSPTVGLRGLMLTGGRSTEGEGAAGIFNESGRLTLTDSTVSGNTAEGAHDVAGGAILNFGTLTLINSTVFGNMARDSSGGGIYNGDRLTLIDSTVSQNTAHESGGGIYNDGEGIVILINSTVSENEAGASGGGIGNRAQLTLTNSTVSGNTASQESDGIFNDFGTLTLTNSTVFGNAAANGGTIHGGDWTSTNSVIVGDCLYARVSSGGHNIESPGDTCGFDEEGDQASVSAEELKLGELADNGGSTETHALLPGGVAIDHVLEAACVDAEGAPLTEDQRGVPRPQGPACDSGAFELEVAP
ncbi:MAG: hypothetical protein JRF55_02905 [Deltaproteobacteria bacterium]|nr:hypothetical protein [Deltaproteobacteria bacterium]